MLIVSQGGSGSSSPIEDDVVLLVVGGGESKVKIGTDSVFRVGVDRNGLVSLFPAVDLVQGPDRSFRFTFSETGFFVPAPFLVGAKVLCHGVTWVPDVATLRDMS